MLQVNPVTGKRNNGKRYTDEDRKWLFETTERLGIGAHSNQMRKLMIERWVKSPSKSTIQTWVKPQELENIKRRNAKYRVESPRYIMSKRVSNFKDHPGNKNGHLEATLGIAKTTRARERGLDSAFQLHMGERLTRFHNKGREVMKRADLSYQIEDAEAHWAVTQDYDKEAHTVKCGICKEELNWMEEAFQLDHIDPTKGNGLENCQITHAMCNQMKTSMNMEELVELCKKVVEGAEK